MNEEITINGVVYVPKQMPKNDNQEKAGHWYLNRYTSDRYRPMIAFGNKAAATGFRFCITEPTEAIEVDYLKEAGYIKSL